MKTHTQSKKQGAAANSTFQPKAKNQSSDASILQAYKKGTAQLAVEEEPIQQKENKTGLPDNLKSGVENLSGHSLDDVKVHYNSSQPASLQAHAYAQGTAIHVAPGQEKHLPHEAWHVVQQKQGRVQPTKQLKGTTNINDDAGLEKEADVMGAKAMNTTSNDAQLQFKTPDNKTKQMAFNGPQFNQAGSLNGNYPNHQFTNNGTQANTGCGTSNTIRTAGERLAPGAASKPGTPTSMNLYRGGFSRGGGLVRDKNLNQASTKMHLINHRLENGSNTQNNSSNIFLGTQKTNNPTHLHQVETPVINSVTNHRSGANAHYETAMANAQQLQEPNGNQVLYWPNNSIPAPAAIPANDLNQAALDHNNDVITPPSIVTGLNKKKPGIPTGKYLDLNGYVGLRHLWLEYTVTPNYAGAPAHIGTNINTETVFAQGKKKKQRNMLLGKIANFTNNFKDNAFPGTFNNDVDYYYASYDPANKYATENENMTINADL
ncbi:MAG: DUF4157 domain-containing protein [Fluviicola sp.]